MSNHLELFPGLEEKVAAMIAPAVGEIARDVQDGAARAAPHVKTWHTMEDERVRPWHRTAHGQAVPDNVKFELDQAPYRGVQHPRGHDYLLYPRDPRAGYLQVAFCRCWTTPSDELARSIRTTAPRVEGTRVVCYVYTDHNRARESNYAGDPPAYFMQKGIQEAAARLHR